MSLGVRLVNLLSLICEFSPFPFLACTLGVEVLTFFVACRNAWRNFNRRIGGVSFLWFWMGKEKKGCLFLLLLGGILIALRHFDTLNRRSFFTITLMVGLLGAV